MGGVIAATNMNNNNNNLKNINCVEDNLPNMSCHTLIQTDQCTYHCYIKEGVTIYSIDYEDGDYTKKFLTNQQLADNKKTIAYIIIGSVCFIVVFFIFFAIAIKSNSKNKYY